MARAAAACPPDRQRPLPTVNFLLDQHTARAAADGDPIDPLDYRDVTSRTERGNRVDPNAIIGVSLWALIRRRVAILDDDCSHPPLRRVGSIVDERRHLGEQHPELAAGDRGHQVVDARAVGTRTLGRACLLVRADCQNTMSRPYAVVNTNCERFSRARSSTGSTATPRRTHDRTGTRSTMSRSSGAGHASAGWQ